MPNCFDDGMIEIAFACSNDDEAILKAKQETSATRLDLSDSLFAHVVIAKPLGLLRNTL
jgi:hypothetical protein